LLPLGGIIGIPFVGLLLDRRTTLEATLVLVLFGLAFGVLTILPQTAPQLIGIGFLVVLRPLFYTYVSDFFAKVFG
jgi:predicted MFS family arabinose efflux permease